MASQITKLPNSIESLSHLPHETENELRQVHSSIEEMQLEHFADHLQGHDAGLEMAYAARGMGSHVERILQSLSAMKSLASCAVSSAERSLATQAGVREAESKSTEATWIASVPKLAHEAARTGSVRGKFVIQLMTRLNETLDNEESTDTARPSPLVQLRSSVESSVDTLKLSLMRELSTPALHVAGATRALGLLRQLYRQKSRLDYRRQTGRQRRSNTLDLHIPAWAIGISTPQGGSLECQLVLDLLSGRYRAMQLASTAASLSGTPTSCAVALLEAGEAAAAGASMLVESIFVPRTVHGSHHHAMLHGSSSSAADGPLQGPNGGLVSAGSERETRGFAGAALALWTQSVLDEIQGRVLAAVGRAGESESQGLAQVYEQCVADAWTFGESCGHQAIAPVVASACSCRVLELLRIGLQRAVFSFDRKAGSARWLSESLIERGRLLSSKRGEGAIGPKAEEAVEMSSRPVTVIRPPSNPSVPDTATGAQHGGASESVDAQQDQLEFDTAMLWFPPLAHALCDFVETYNRLRPCLQCVPSDGLVEVMEAFLCGMDDTVEETRSSGRLGQAMLAEGYGADDVIAAHGVLSEVQEDLSSCVAEAVARFASSAVGECVGVATSV